MEVIDNSQRPNRFRISKYRNWIQIGFILITIWIGIEFYIFVNQLEQGIDPIARPPGVEAFLPISALISLKYLVLTGIINHIHPSALILLLIFGATGLFLKKGFCSWICPFGWFSEILTKLHIKIFDRQFKLPKWLDYPLRSIKYLLLFFFLWAVFWQMSETVLKTFIYSPYNRVADIKMMYFFTQMSDFTFWTLAILIGMSLAIPFFWCRYLCPYGALLGALGWLSPLKIHRNTTSCIDCEKCSKVCPAKILVHRDKTVFSDECHACLTCVDACPVKDTLYLSVTKSRYRMSRKTYAWVIVALFLTGVSAAQIFGVWENGISDDEYLYHIQNINGPEYHHNQGEVSKYDQEKWQPKSGKKELKIQLPTQE